MAIRTEASYTFREGFPDANSCLKCCLLPYLWQLHQWGQQTKSSPANHDEHPVSYVNYREAKTKQLSFVQFKELILEVMFSTYTSILLLPCIFIWSKYVINKKKKCKCWYFWVWFFGTDSQCCCYNFIGDILWQTLEWVISLQCPWTHRLFIPGGRGGFVSCCIGLFVISALKSKGWVHRLLTACSIAIATTET